MKKIKLLLNTIKYLKPIQIFYQIKYRVQKAKSLDFYKSDFNSEANFFSFTKIPPVYQSYLGNNEFDFLNQKKQFNKDVIEWNFQAFGKLWNYNLQYGNYLLQEDISEIEKNKLLMSLYRSLSSGELQMEPYPASLRIINVIRFYSLQNVQNEMGFSFLHAELNFLSSRLEFHLLGNHLLENSFALLMGGAFFSNNDWVNKAQRILEKELKEQILKDGAHFELSPMYHQIIFFRILELIDWYSSYSKKDKDLENLLASTAGKMRSWLENISFQNGDIPHFNDSAIGISYSTKWLIDYADSLGIQSSNIPLGVSGYRSISHGNYECKIDLAAVGPDYQPGHAHADSLSFIVYYNNQPLFVDAGTSTYQPGEIRSRERSTFSHNTVVVNGVNQSQIWGGFRVARRAETTILNDSLTLLSAEHDGYKGQKIIHRRDFNFADGFIKIVDHLQGNIQEIGEFYLHISPGLEFKMDNEKIIIKNEIFISFSNNEQIALLDYEMANGYNQYLAGKKIVVRFKNKLETTIKFIKAS